MHADSIRTVLGLRKAARKLGFLVPSIADVRRFWMRHGDRYVILQFHPAWVWAGDSEHPDITQEQSMMVICSECSAIVDGTGYHRPPPTSINRECTGLEAV